MSMEHKELIELAGRWLRRRCGVVLTEYSCWNSGEIADAIGFRPWPKGSIVIECKVSRRDFLADQHKNHRHVSHHMGNYCYYLTNINLVYADEVPESWGLLYVIRGQKIKVRVVKEAPLQTDPEIKAAEFQLLYSLARRAVLRGLLPQLRGPLGRGGF
jgi:hypothetical protein